MKLNFSYSDLTLVQFLQQTFPGCVLGEDALDNDDEGRSNDRMMVLIIDLIDVMAHRMRKEPDPNSFEKARIRFEQMITALEIKTATKDYYLKTGHILEFEADLETDRFMLCYSFESKEIAVGLIMESPNVAIIVVV